MSLQHLIIFNNLDLKLARKSTLKNQIRLYVGTLALVVIAIAIGGTRERQDVASPKLRYTTSLPNSWLAKYKTGCPPSTPILYCGSQAAKGYYKLGANFTAYEASADDLCESIPRWYWVSSPTLSWLFNVVLVVQYIFKNVVLNMPKAKKRTIALIIILVTRFAIFTLIDEPKGSASDASDHIFLQSVFIWALLWDIWTSLMYPTKGRHWVWLWNAFWIIAFLVSLGITSGIFHTSDEMWEGFKQSAFFLAAAGLVAYYFTKEKTDSRGEYSQAPKTELTSSEKTTQDIEKQPLNF